MDSEVSTYYWSAHKLLEDGSLFMPTSVYGPRYHSSGEFHVTPEKTDFDFWVWLINEKKPMRRIGKREYGRVHSSDLEALRLEYQNRFQPAAPLV